jgi:TatD DNase family protein
MPLFDAHFHPQHPRLRGLWPDLQADLAAIGWAGGVANGTGPADWPQVAALAAADPRLQPAYGLHPWSVGTAPADWRDQLRRMLDGGACCVGEIGLDGVVNDADLAAQEAAFAWQWEEAHARGLPVAIHCVRAWEPLLQLLRALPPLPRGFLLHAYGGGPERVPELTRLGARFSFSARLAHPRAQRAQLAARAVPIDRLLVETDAPDMPPPAAVSAFSLEAADGSGPCNHPANLAAGYTEVAGCCGNADDPAAFHAQVAANYRRLFQPD